MLAMCQKPCFHTENVSGTSSRGATVHVRLCHTHREQATGARGSDWCIRFGGMVMDEPNAVHSAELQNKLDTSSASGNPHAPVGSDYTSGSSLGHSPAGPSLENNWTAIVDNSSNLGFDPLSTSPNQFLGAFSSPPTSISSALHQTSISPPVISADAPSTGNDYPLFNEASLHGVQGISPSLPSASDLPVFDIAWPPRIPPAPLLHHIVEVFFSSVPQAHRIVDKPSFMNALLESPLSPSFP